MRRIICLLSAAALAGAVLAAPAAPQRKTPVKKPGPAATAATAVPANLLAPAEAPPPIDPTPAPSFTYDPLGRRDPFRDLLAGRDVKEKAVGGLAGMSIDDLNLVGIVSYKGRFTAIVSGPQGFPYYLKAGDKFADGFVLSIGESQAVFRKVSERGLPLMRPKDIVKEINPEER